MKKLVVASVIAMSMAGSAQAVTLVNGGFETGFTGNFQTLQAGSTALSGWTIESGDVDLIGTYWQNAEGSNSLDLSGTAPGSIAQTLSDFIVGASYTVFFALSGNPAGAPVVKTMLASFTPSSGPSESQAFTFDSGNQTLKNMGWTTNSFSFVAGATSGVLRFASQTATFFGPALDDVRIVEKDIPPAVVPLPAAGFLLLGALGLMGAVRRRKTHTAA